MTDLELTRLCAEAMGYTGKPPASPSDIVLFVTMPASHPMLPKETVRYDPLHDDAQAMALLKRFSLYMPISILNSPDINRAICVCVADIQAQV